MQEVWKAVAGFEDYYEVSNLGRVRRIKGGPGAQSGKVLKQNMGGGYQYVILSNNGKIKRFSVHRLVAQAFIPNPDNKPEVNHIDGNRLNNSIDNLEWVTRGENMQHAWRNGLCEGTKGTLWINNGIENLVIKPEKLQEYLTKGYVKGRKLLVG